GARGDGARGRNRGAARRRDVLVRASRRRCAPGADLQARALLPDAVPRRPLRRPGRGDGRRPLVLARPRRDDPRLPERAGPRRQRAGLARQAPGRTPLARGLRIVLAPNRGFMTGPGTNQYLFGDDDALLLDVATLDDENRRRFAASGVRPAALALTHTHP